MKIDPDQEKECIQKLNEVSLGELITVTKTGIVTTYKILIDNGCEQLIHSGGLFYRYVTSLKFQDLSGNTYIKEDIKKFNAVYFNGVQIVRKGKVYY